MVRAVHAPLLLDVVIGLLVAVALPLAIVAIPNTISIVAALLPPGVQTEDMMRAHGLALPAIPLARVLGFAPLPPAFLAFVALATVAYLGVVEIAKSWLVRSKTALLRRKYRPRKKPGWSNW